MFPIIILLSALFCAPSHAQPARCLDDTQCPEGNYCATEAEYCVKCASCEDFGRKPGPLDKCIKTVGECGPCLDRLVADQTLHCLLPDEEAEGMPAYTWGIIIGVILVAVFLIILVFIYIFKENVLKISSRMLLRGASPAGTGGELNLHASAPDPPPPYNPYSPLRPDSPPAHVPSDGMHYMDTRDEDQDTSGPFIKRALSSHRAQPLESDGSQNARVYNKPNYMRHRSPTLESKFDDDDDNFSPIQDEDTTESTWTPAGDSNNINGNASSNETSLVRATRTNGAGAAADGGAGAGAGAGTGVGAGDASSLPALLAAARDTTLLEPPAKKAKEHVNDSNNNGNTGAMANDSGTNNNTSHQNAQAAAMYLNIQVNNYPRNVLHYN